jgi:hypothetical protein
MDGPDRDGPIPSICPHDIYEGTNQIGLKNLLIIKQGCELHDYISHPGALVKFVSKITEKTLLGSGSDQPEWESPRRAHPIRTRYSNLCRNGLLCPRDRDSGGLM